MARMAYSESFLKSRASVVSTRTRARVDKMLRTIEQMPGVGSSLAAPSVRERYGQHVLKALVSPYLIIYEYDRAQDTALIYDLINCWTVQ